MLADERELGEESAMLKQDSRVDAVRKRIGDRQNHLVDELFAGRLSRRDFIRRSTIAGMSVSTAYLLSSSVVAAGSRPGVTKAVRANDQAAGGTLRAGTIRPGRALDPLTIGDTGASVLVGQTAEYLALSSGAPELQPVLAESWSPNEDASIWTFKIRSGVRFHDGRPMTARDVAASFNFAADPANGTNALEAWEGILSAGACTATDDTTVVMELDKPIGAWPWLVSSDNSSATILPEGFTGPWEESWMGTGPWRLESYTPGVSASLVRNEDYWGLPTLADRIVFTLFEDQMAMLLALQAGDVQAVSQFGVSAGLAVLEDSTRFKTIVTPSSTHWPWTLKSDDPSLPTGDKRVRRALALMLDRTILVDELLAGYAQAGNDSPFAPIHAATDPSVPQRVQDIEQARALLAEAGYADGFTLPVSVWDVASNAEYAQIAQDFARELNVRLELTVMDTPTFLGSGEFGSAPQLDSVSAIGDWGHRGIPNVFLGAQLRSDGVRNAAHWHNSQFDALVDQFFAEPDLQVQRTLARQMQEMLLDETPIIYAYFASLTRATTPEVDGIVATPTSLMLFDQATGASS